MSFHLKNNSAAFPAKNSFCSSYEPGEMRGSSFKVFNTEAAVQTEFSPVKYPKYLTHEK